MISSIEIAIEELHKKQSEGYGFDKSSESDVTTNELWTLKACPII